MYVEIILNAVLAAVTAVLPLHESGWQSTPRSFACIIYVLSSLLRYSSLEHACTGPNAPILANQCYAGTSSELAWAGEVSCYKLVHTHVPGSPTHGSFRGTQPGW